MKDNLKLWFPGVIITGSLVLSEIIFIIIIAKTALLSVRIILLCLAALLGIAAIVYLLVRDKKYHTRFIIGCVLTAIMLIAELVGGYYIGQGASALGEIAKPKKEFADFGVYVRVDDEAKNILDVSGYSFGILEELDRNSTDLALKQITKKLEDAPTISTFSEVDALLEGLTVSKTVDAIILNKAFLDILDDIEGHENDLNLIREIYALQILVDDSTIQTPTNSKNDDTFTIYITGIDTRSKKISRKSRSDVNILATVNKKSGQIILISTPRDYYVPLSISNGIPDKLTHSGVYGTQVSIDTMEMLYDIEIDYYFKLNFYGFKDIIDALGGIVVNSDVKFSAGGYTFMKGYNEVNGAAALAFARERKSIGGDRHRGKHQLEVVKGVIDKATSPALIANYASILEGIKGSFETSMPYDEIAKLVRNQLENNTSWNVQSYTVNGKGDSKKPYSLSTKAYVLIPDQATVDHAKELMAQVRNGKVPSPNAD